MRKLLVCLIFVAGIVRADSSGVFNIRTGVGYDFISQEYFSDSARYAFGDSTLKSALLIKDFLDDKKGFVFLKYNKGNLYTGRSRYFLEGALEQSDDIFRILGTGQFGLKDENDLFETSFGLEVKERYRGVAVEGEELTILDWRSKYRRRLKPDLEGLVRAFYENVSFDITSQYIYNYARFGGQAGFEYITGNFNSYQFLLTAERRQVPDSSDLDYNMIRGNAGYLGKLFSAQVSAEIDYENKDYALPDNRDDYQLLTFYGSSRVPLSPDYYLAATTSMESFFFKSEDFNDNYLLLRMKAGLGRQLGDFDFRVGPGLELLSVETGFTFDDDYAEYLGVVEFDYLPLDGILIILENEVGRRNYKNQLSYTSDYILDRLTLIGGIKFWRTLTFDIFLSTEWEWHEIDSDNTRLYLISSSFSYTF